MKIQEYYKRGIALESLPLKILQGIDIESPDEEKIIQELVNRKLQNTPVRVLINRPEDRTDFKTREEELEFQKIIDQRLALARPGVEEFSKFCDFCDAKGPIAHKKSCTRK